MKPTLYTEIIPQEESIFKKLYSWESPERYWVPRERGWYISYSLFFVLIIGVAAILGEFLFILAVVAFVFLWFIQAAIPPHMTEHVVTSIGIKTYEKLYRWANIKHFWFADKDGIELLMLDIVEDNPTSTMTKRLTLILNEPNQDLELFPILIKYVDYGDRDEIGYNFVIRYINGKHRDVSEYMEDDEITTMEMLQENAILNDQNFDYIEDPKKHRTHTKKPAHKTSRKK